MFSISSSKIASREVVIPNVKEKQLFVNTMVAAYASGTRAPVMDVMDMYDNTLNSVYLMFDEANRFFIDGIAKVEGK